MKECDNCAYGGWLNGKDAITEICTKCRYICGEPTKWKAKPMTNADRIRAMSDEKLADAWIRCNTICHLCAYRDECEFDEYVIYEKCKEGIMEWLKQPADMRGEEE